MAATRSFTGLFSRLSLGSGAAAPSSLLSTTTTSATVSAAVRCLSTTSSQAAKAPSGGRTKKKKKGVEVDPRIINLRQSLPRAVPAPLRFGRNRYLRHWTIHRAWMLFQRQDRERKEKELNRMYQSMHNACEELRNTSGPGTRDEGYLYRVAMGKQGIYGKDSIPIEYSRLQTETPPREIWNHDWKR